MNIQSLSIVVPNNSCINKCAFCVSRMHCDDYTNDIFSVAGKKNTYKHFNNIDEYKKRLEFARDNGCNTVMLTGTSEPQQNRRFLEFFGLLNKRLEKPFRWIELQTTGVLLDSDYLTFLKNDVGVSTISISISSFTEELNRKYIGVPEKVALNVKSLCKKIKDLGFNLRLSINLTDSFNNYYDEDLNNSNKAYNLFEDIKEYYNPDQVTFRVLYANGNTEQANWVRKHSCDENIINVIKNYIKQCGSKLERLPYGMQKYSVHGMSVVIDDDCMSKESEEDYKYLILRPNCKLYSRWDDKASLIF